MMFLPKSLSEAGSFSSAMRYSRSFFQLNMYMPMEARLLFGFLGFSSNSFMYPSPPMFMMPKRDASSMDT